MRQRVGIAQALLDNPKLLIVDEPAVGLDPGKYVRFHNLNPDLAGHRIIIPSTHIVSDDEASASSIALINQGRLLRYAASESLLDCVQSQVREMVVDRFLYRWLSRIFW